MVTATNWAPTTRQSPHPVSQPHQPWEVSNIFPTFQLRLREAGSVTPSHGEWRPKSQTHLVSPATQAPNPCAVVPGPQLVQNGDHVYWALS